MYKQGIPSTKIAAGAGIAQSTVRYHLSLAVKAQPELRDEHKAALVAVTRQTSAGLQNMDDVIAFHQTEGRLPTTGGKTARERALGVWLHRRRQDAMVGALSPAYIESLSAIPGWEVSSTRQADNEARWGRRLSELVEYMAAGNDWPRHKKPANEQERALGVWLHVQRITYRGGTMTPSRESQLNVVPGWREGRARSGGRRAAGVPQRR
jgi:hypothetical protein